MKKATLTVLSLALVGLLAAGAWAAGPYYGGGYGGRGYCAGAPATGPVDREAAAKFSAETQELRKTLAVKRLEMQTLLAQPQADESQVRALGDQIVELQAQLAKKANQAGLAAGYGRGYGKSHVQGRGQGRGYGRGGYGQSYGACWR